MKLNPNEFTIESTSAFEMNGLSPNDKLENTPSFLDKNLIQIQKIIDDSLIRSLELGQIWFLVSKQWMDKLKLGLKDKSTSIANDGIPVLKPNLVDNLDYVLVPCDMYTKLKGIFGIISKEHELSRKVIKSGMEFKQLKVEVYLLRLHVCLSKNEKLVKNLTISRRITLGDLREELLTLLQLTKSVNYKLYIHHGQDEKNDTYEEVGKNGDDSTPLEYIFSSENVLVFDIVDEDGRGSIPMKKIDKTSSLNGKSLFGTSSYSESNSSSSLMYKQSESVNYTPGICGLQNLGNTCFMNSAIQMLSNVPPLTDYFISSSFENDINETNPLGMGGALARAYGDVIVQLWSGHNRSGLPRRLKTVIGQFAPRFSGWRQQDSQELAGFLLDGLHEDLNKVVKKPYVEERDWDERPDKEVATESWQYWKSRNDSRIVDLFYGQLKSTLVCPDCSEISVKFDPFNFLPLPLPQKHGGNRYDVAVTFVPKEHDKPSIKYKLTIMLNSRYESPHYSDLCEQIVKVTGVEPDQLIFVEIASSGHVSKFPDDQDIIVSQNAWYKEEIAIYEVDGDVEDEQRATIVVQHGHSKSPSSCLNWPLIWRIATANLTKSQIGDQICTKLSPVSCPDSSNESMDLSSVDHSHLFSMQVGCSQSGSWIDFPNCPNESFEIPTESIMHVGKVPGPVVFVNVRWRMDMKIEFEAAKKKIIDDASMKPRRVDIYDCLDLFTRQEKLGQDNLWNCPRCKNRCRASKTLELWRLPEFLFISLKRFQDVRSKIDTVVQFPVKNFDLRNWVLDENHGHAIYDLIAISNHSGGLGGGHYTAWAINNNDWVFFNDSHASKLAKSEDVHRNLVTREAYLLLYKRRDFSPSIVEPNIEMECED